MAFTVSIEDLREGFKVVRPEGRLDTTGHAILDTALAPVVASFTGTLVFNMSRLEFISSAGLSVLFKTRKAMAGRLELSRMANWMPSKTQPSPTQVFMICSSSWSVTVWVSTTL